MTEPDKQAERPQQTEEQLKLIGEVEEYLHDVIEDQATLSVVNNTAVDELDLNWVWMPPWGPQFITEEGREQLRALGFAV